QKRMEQARGSPPIQLRHPPACPPRFRGLASRARPPVSSRNGTEALGYGRGGTAMTRTPGRLGRLVAATLLVSSTCPTLTPARTAPTRAASFIAERRFEAGA